MEQIKDFKVDGLRYRVYMDDISGLVSFSLRGGYSKKGKVKHQLLFEDDDVYDDQDITINTFKVIKEVKKIILDWIWKTKPHEIQFQASTKRKIKIYRHYAKLLEKSLLGKYNLYETRTGEFNFYIKSK